MSETSLDLLVAVDGLTIGSLTTFNSGLVSATASLTGSSALKASGVSCSYPAVSSKPKREAPSPLPSTY